MITIEQLLESVDLDFEPRWVTKDENNNVWVADTKPSLREHWWGHRTDNARNFGRIKLAEFDGKDWTECIYEVPRKTDEYEQNLEKTRPADSDLVYRVNLPRKVEKTGKIEKIEKLKNALLKYIFDNKEYETTTAPSLEEMTSKINELVDAVNELKGNK